MTNTNKIAAAVIGMGAVVALGGMGAGIANSTTGVGSMNTGSTTTMETPTVLPTAPSVIGTPAAHPGSGSGPNDDELCSFNTAYRTTHKDACTDIALGSYGHGGSSPAPAAPTSGPSDPPADPPATP